MGKVTHFIFVCAIGSLVGCATGRIQPDLGPTEIIQKKQRIVRVTDESGRTVTIRDHKILETVELIGILNNRGEVPCFYLPSVASLRTAPDLEAKIEAFANELESAKDGSRERLTELKRLLVALHAEQREDVSRLALVELGIKSSKRMAEELTPSEIAALLTHYRGDDARFGALDRLWEVSDLKPNNRRNYPDSFDGEDAKTLIETFDTPLGKASAYAKFRYRVQRPWMSDSGNPKADLDQYMAGVLLPDLLDGKVSPSTKVEILSAMPAQVARYISDEQRDLIRADISSRGTREQWVRAHGVFMVTPPKS